MDLTNLVQSALPQLLEGKLNLSADETSKVAGGLSDSLVGGLKEFAGQEGGLQKIMALVGGEGSEQVAGISSAVSSFFETNVADKLGLSADTTSQLKAQIPALIDTLMKQVKNGDLDVSSIIASLTGGKDGGNIMDTVKDLAGGFLGKLFK